jgi:hypothetical protein
MFKTLMLKMFKHSKGCSSSHASSTSSSEPNANLYRLVILPSYLGHLPSLHFFFLQGVGAWSSKLKWNVWLDFKANISWNLTNYALEISYSYIAWEEVTFDVSIKLWKFNEGLGRTFLHMLLVSTINDIARQGNILFWHVRSLFIIWYNLCKCYFPMWGNLWFLFSINARIESSSKSILASN